MMAAPLAHDRPHFERAMTLLSATSRMPAATESSERAVGAPARRGPQGLAFSEALSQLSSKSAVVTVKAGEHLSGLIQKHLQDTPGSPQLSADQLYRVALKVAADNGIANANLIYPEQRIDLSSAASTAAALAPSSDSPSDLASPGGPIADPVPGPFAIGPGALASPAPSRVGPGTDGASLSGPRAFLAQHAQAARQAQAKSGIPATFMVAQAALESGWGKQEIRHPDGQTSHNLFGIRTSPNWKGPVAEVWTTEYVNGSPQRVRGQFRAYASYEESFNDYARLISQNPRYAQAMRNLGDSHAFAASLQQAGYATDPHYAKVLSSVIQTAQRLQGGPTDVAAAALPSTTQMLNMRSGGWPASASPLAAPLSPAPSALNTLPGGMNVPGVAQRSWRQSPYAALDTASRLP